MPKITHILLFSLFLFLIGCTETPDLQDIATERIDSIVTIHYTLKYEEERDRKVVYGTVVDDNGLIMAQKVAPSYLPDSWIDDIKIYPFDENSEGYSAKYIGHDDQTGFFYFRADDELIPKLSSVFSYGTTQAKELMPAWGISSLDYNQNFYIPFFLQSSVGSIEHMHVKLGVCGHPVSAIGGPVFCNNGKFMGIVFDGLVMGHDLQLDGKVYSAALRKRRIGEIFLITESLEQILMFNPEVELPLPQAWLGIAGLQPLPKDAMLHLGYSDNSALVISQIFKGSAAENSSLQVRDIILGLDGKPFPFFPDLSATVSYLKLYVAKFKKPGDIINLSILRNGETIDVPVTLMPAPEKERNLPRLYLSRIGATIRDFSFIDSINHKLYTLDQQGVVVQYVRPNSPADDAGLLEDDWIKEIDGQEISSYQQALDILSEIEHDTSIPSFVLLVERSNDTKLLRVKMN